MTADTPGLAARVVRWQIVHGRNHLPWQNTRDPYRVWLSEIMLQQTQVATVLAFFARFLTRFPDVRSLAAASQDDVLGLWSGLGYYSRARNLHACAQQLVAQHQSLFPRSAKILETLPGIGRSTAGAIASLCFGERVAILDGNVKRVLTRVLGFDSDLAKASSERALWDLAGELLPGNDLETTMQRYTQGMMDLGATVCLARKPLCLVCPLSDICVAGRAGTAENYPVKSRKIKRSAQSLWLLWARTEEGKVYLQKRPTPGVWAGLYCFPVFDDAQSLALAVPAHEREKLQDGPVFKHVLTHKDLHLHPVRIQLPALALANLGGEWIAAAAWSDLGLPAPVRKLLLQA